MEGFSVTTEAIAATGSGVSGVAAALDRETLAMQGLLDDLQAGWRSSDAAPRFAAAMGDHLAQACVLRDALLSHGDSLVGVGRRFDEAEAAVAAAVPAVTG